MNKLKNQGDDSWQSHRETLDQRKWEAEEGFRLQRATNGSISSPCK